MNIIVLFFSLILLMSCAHTDSSKNYKGHGADSVSPELLKKFAPKPIASGKLNRIESMLDVRSPGMGMLTPDGEHLFFSWAVTGTRQIWKMSQKEKFPLQMTG